MSSPADQWDHSRGPSVGHHGHAPRAPRVAIIGQEAYAMHICSTLDRNCVKSYTSFALSNLRLLSSFPALPSTPPPHPPSPSPHQRSQAFDCSGAAQLFAIVCLFFSVVLFIGRLADGLGANQEGGELGGGRGWVPANHTLALFSCLLISRNISLSAAIAMQVCSHLNP